MPAHRRPVALAGGLSARLARGVCLTMGLLPVVVVAATQPLPVPDLTGRWHLDYDASDPPESRLPTSRDDAAGRRPGPLDPFGGLGGRYGTRDRFERRPSDERPQTTAAARAAAAAALDDLLTAPRRMTIDRRRGELRLAYDDGRVVRLLPDDRDHAGIAADGVQLRRRTRWRDGRLHVEIRLEHAPPVVQVYEPHHEGRLTVVTTIEPRGRFDGVELRRVYTRAPRE